MKFLNACRLAVAAVLVGGLLPVTHAQTAGNVYYDATPWPLPADGGTSAFRLTGMTSVHAVWIAFNNYVGDKPIADSPVITLLPGSVVKWSAPQGGCNYELELINANPPLINMRKPSAMCSLRPGAQAIFKIFAAP
jgi:hypothetical protein